MKGSGIFLSVILVLVIALMGYYNFQQMKTIELLNDEILKQARLRHNLILKTHTLEKKIEELSSDTIQSELTRTAE